MYVLCSLILSFRLLSVSPKKNAPKLFQSNPIDPIQLNLDWTWIVQKIQSGSNRASIRLQSGSDAIWDKCDNQTTIQFIFLGLNPDCIKKFNPLVNLT